MRCQLRLAREREHPVSTTYNVPVLAEAVHICGWVLGRTIDSSLDIRSNINGVLQLAVLLTDLVQPPIRQ